MLRSAFARTAHIRLLSTTTRLQKGPIEVAKDAAKTIDRTVSDAAVAGIEAGEKATAKVKETVGMDAGEAKGKASEVAGQAKGKAHELTGQAKGKAEELKGKM